MANEILNLNKNQDNTFYSLNETNNLNSIYDNIIM